MKSKILVIALSTLCIILASVIVYASVVMSLYNDRYGGMSLQASGYSEMYTSSKEPETLKLNLFGVDYTVKYKNSQRSYQYDDLNRHYYVNEEDGYKASWYDDRRYRLNDKESLASVGSTDPETPLFEYGVGEIVYDEYVDWLKDVIYEVYEADVSEYILTCRTVGKATNRSGDATKTVALDRFVQVGEEDIVDIKQQRFYFTKHINGFKTNEQFTVNIIPGDGGIISIGHTRYSPSTLVTETEYDEEKIMRSIDAFLAMSKAARFPDMKYLGNCKLKEVVLKKHSGRDVLQCRVVDWEYEYNGVKGVETRFVDLYLYLDS